MISEHVLQNFMYYIRDIKYDIIHDFKVSIPTCENILHRVLSCRALQVQVQNQRLLSSTLLN
jgi:hypothetical protein